MCAHRGRRRRDLLPLEFEDAGVVAEAPVVGLGTRQPRAVDPRLLSRPNADDLPAAGARGDD